MSKTKTPPSFLAIDLGAESGRAMLGVLEDGNLTLTEIHRFPNNPVRIPDGLHWDVLRLWSELKTGIGLAARQSAGNLTGIGLDTWGVDFALLDKHGALVGNPFAYRDNRTDDMLEEAFRRMPRQQLFETTGIQFMSINTLFQLLAVSLKFPAQFEIAETLLMMPDLFNYWLSGKMVGEFTIATTTQCYDPRKKDWAWQVLEKMGIPTRIFPRIVPPGTVLGPLSPDLAAELGVERASVIAPACHDTGSAVAAVPAEDEDFAWISSGTWSIMGAEVLEPVLDDQTLRYNFTNEGGVRDTWRLSRNIAGLWLVQECRRAWAQQGDDLSYDEITHLASQAEPFQAFVDPDHNDFLKPGDMPERIQNYCRETGQPVPESKQAIVRCALEGLAFKYRWVLERLEQITSQRLEPVYIIGGGAKNRLLNQFTADVTGRRCIAGPDEATAIGNILMQAIALGHIRSLEAARAIVRSSFTPQVYQPRSQTPWNAAYARFLEVTKNS